MSRKHRVPFYGAAVASCLVVGLALLAYRGHAQAPTARAANAGRAQLIDNPRVTVLRLTTAPGTIEKPHAHADEDFVTIQLTPGDLEVTVGNETTKGGQGKAWWLPKATNHAVNNKGTSPVDVIVVRVK